MVDQSWIDDFNKRHSKAWEGDMREQETQKVLSVVRSGLRLDEWAVARRTLDESGTEISRKELFSGFDSHEAAAEMMVDLMKQEDM